MEDLLIGILFIYGIASIFVALVMVIDMEHTYSLVPKVWRISHVMWLVFFPASIFVAYTVVWCLFVPIEWISSLRIWSKPLFKKDR